MPHRAKFDAAFLVFPIFPLQFLYSPTPKQKIKLSVILYSMFVLGWLALVSVPLGAVGLLGFRQFGFWWFFCQNGARKTGCVIKTM